MTLVIAAHPDLGESRIHHAWLAALRAHQSAALTINAKPRRIDPPFLDDVKDRQMQIDCEGFKFQGKPRHAEFVFGDDSLKMVWIMTDPDERVALENAMRTAYGAPKYINEEYSGFTASRVVLRLDRAEVLFYAKDADKGVLPDITKPASAGAHSGTP